MRNSIDVGRTVILEFDEPTGVNIPIGATGKAWIAAPKPIAFLDFLHLAVGFMLRLLAAESYLMAL